MLCALFRILEHFKMFLPLKISDMYLTVFQSLFIEARDGELATEILEGGTGRALPVLSSVPVRRNCIKPVGRRSIASV